MTLSKQIKKELNKNKVKNSVRTHGGTITVELKSSINSDLLNLIKSMETTEAHGCAYADTRYFTGQSIQFRYEFEATKEEKAKALKIMDKYSHWEKETPQGFNSWNYHAKNELRAELGPVAEVLRWELGLR